VCDALRERGWYVIRSSGSHGVADVIGLRDGAIVVVQCKYDRGRVESVEWSALWTLAEQIGATPYIADRSGPRRGVVMWQMLGLRPARKHMNGYLSPVRWEAIG
jgi:Holliday junction resolvase